MVVIRVVPSPNNEFGKTKYDGLSCFCAYCTSALPKQCKLIIPTWQIKAPLQSQKTLLGFVSELPKLGCVHASNSCWIWLKNGDWTWSRHTRTCVHARASSSERSCEMSFALRFLPPLVLLSPTRRCHTKRQDTCDLAACLWRDKFSNYDFACFCSTLRHQTLQQETLGGIVYENTSFMQLQFT